MEREYLIWSAEHQAWWAAGERGYSKGIMHAGRYSRDRALQICINALPGAHHLGHIAEVPVRIVDIEAMLTHSLFAPEAVMGDHESKRPVPDDARMASRDQSWPEAGVAGSRYPETPFGGDSQGAGRPAAPSGDAED